MRDQFRNFLRAHDYLNAPFTIENVDYAFNVLVSDARRRQDPDAVDRARDAYIEHTMTVTRYFEALSVDTFGREIPQILLIHVNLINDVALRHLLREFRDRGYRFVTVEEALQDPAYATPDDFVGRYGPSWLHRFRVSLGLPRRTDEPDPPSWVMDAYGEITSGR